MTRPWARLLCLLPAVLPALLGGALSGCAGLAGSHDPDLSELVWPPGEPRVRLERVIPLGQRPAGRAARIFRKIADLKARPFLLRPYAVAWDGEDLLVTDPSGGRVARIAPRGRIQLSADGLFEGPIGVAVCRAGIVVSDSRGGRLALLGPKLHLRRWLAEGLERPTGVVCRDGEVFVVETGKHRILVYTPEADAEPRVLGGRGDGDGELNFPAALALDGASLWVGDTLNFRLQKLDAASGAYLDGFGRLGDSPGEMPRIKGVAVDRDGHLWVSDAHLDQVAIYGRDGAFLLAIGTRGEAPGELSFPSGVASRPDGRVVVVDSLNRRLQVFRLVEPFTPQTVEKGG